MPIIAPHHLPGGFCLGTRSTYVPTCDWPLDCMVQWGGDGIVLRTRKGDSDDAGSYRTAFFEAFPNKPSTFIRGEGETVALAEAAAFKRWQAIQCCHGHEFERRHMRNGGGICKHCGFFESRAFESMEHCVVCKAPTFFTYGTDSAGVTHWYCEEHKALRDPATRPNALDKMMAALAKEDAPGA